MSLECHFAALVLAPGPAPALPLAEQSDQGAGLYSGSAEPYKTCALPAEAPHPSVPVAGGSLDTNTTTAGRVSEKSALPRSTTLANLENASCR